MSPLEVREVRTRADLRRFVELPYRLHARDPHWTPPLRRDVARALARERNPFFEHGDAAYFLAERGGGVAGRIAAIENRAHNEFHGDRVGFFGFFESAEDAEVAGALVERAGEWLAGRGLEALRGPASFSTNDECGLLVEGFDRPGTVLTPHNPPHYGRLLESVGFAKAKDLYLYERQATDFPERWARRAEQVARRLDVSLRPLEKRRFGEELAAVQRLYNQAWEANWGFVPMTAAELRHLAAELRPLVVEDMVAFAERGGETVGFAVALPDYNVALRANRSGRLFPGLLKVLWAARRIERCRILLLGVLPELRGSGVDALMIHWIWQRSTARGMRWGEAGWILEDNALMQNALTRLGFERYRTLRLYEKPLSAS